MHIVVLGCGSSAGVPLIGCNCPVCTSQNPKNKRSRVSVYVEVDGLHLLIDSSPDLRQQALANGINRIDAVLYTHEHADHVHGIDDLRSFNYLRDDVLPVYGSEFAMEAIEKRFSYAFGAKTQEIWAKPSLIAHKLPELPVQDFYVGSHKITAFEQVHGGGKTLGFRIGNFAYSTDVNELSEAAFEALNGVEIWVVDCLRFKPAYNHAHLEKTLGWIERVKPQKAILTHMSHEFDYEILSRELPLGVIMGYDGLSLTI